MALVLPFVSCQKDLVPDTDQQQDLEGIVLTLKCQEPERNTRAGTSGTKPGIAAWNENKLRVLDIYFYRQGATGSNAVKHVRHLSGADDRVTVPVNVTDAEIENIAPRATTNNFYVYVLANYPDTTALNNLTNTSLTHLKELTLNTDFVSNHLQNSFVMDGEVQASIESRTRRLVARAEVDLKRVAAKITVHINIPDTIEVRHLVVAGGDTAEVIEHWKANTNEMKVYLVNGVRTAVVGATPQDNPTYFTYRGNMLTFSRSEAVVDTPYVWICDPMYMYPQHWEFGSETPPNMEPTLKLQLPWTRVAEHGLSQVKKQFYYKILVPNDARGGDYLRTFVRNNWYKFKIDIGILGSETDEASIDLTGHYYIEEWQDKEVVIKHAEIGHARYLSVEQDYFDLNNEVDLSVFFTSSHPVVLDSIVVTKPFYGSGSTYTDEVGSITPQGTTGAKYISYTEAQRKARNNNEDWLKVVGSHVVFHHELNNNLSSNYMDTTPYTISFIVIQKDQLSVSGTSYKQRVTITQYPAIYIKPEENYDFSADGDGYNNHHGYVYVNGESGRTSATGTNGYNYSGGLSNNSRADNNNPDLYSIHVTVLDDDQYVIGDPRSDEVNNYTGGNPAWVTAGGKTLTYYYPAEYSARTKPMIAPVVRVASSYGKTSAMNFENAHRRCASYQEDGFPAGRWRLPTYSEIRFILTLSDRGVLPKLFQPETNNGYWCANGAVYSASAGATLQFTETITGNTTRSVRCVYDEWYWGNDRVNRTTFTWGDQERN